MDGYATPSQALHQAWSVLESDPTYPLQSGLDAFQQVTKTWPVSFAAYLGTLEHLRPLAELLVERLYERDEVAEVERTIRAYQAFDRHDLLAESNRWAIGRDTPAGETVQGLLAQRREAQHTQAAEEKIIDLEERALEQFLKHQNGEPRRISPPAIASARSAVAFFASGQHIFAVDYRPDRPDIVRLPLHKAELIQLRLKLNHFLAAGLREVSRSTATALLKAIYDGLLAPLEARAPLSGTVDISPDPALADIPFAALFDGETYLCERAAVRIRPIALHSSGPLVDLNLERPAVFANDETGGLPHILNEGGQIAEMLGQAGSPHQSCAAFRKLAPQASLLHVSAHARLRNRSPFFSGLALQDGQWTVLDQLQESIQADLVNLSGCQTGRAMFGERPSEVGFVRAFLASGANAVLSSLWRIEDASAAEMMEAFYRHLLAGDPTHVALQLAQQAQIEAGGRGAHPYYWAAYQLTQK